ncbi:13189_t:CDS:2, partial [Gigaspora rosea]
YIFENESFYASLHARPTLQSQEVSFDYAKAELSNNVEHEELIDEDKEIEMTSDLNFISFLNEVKSDYQSAGQPLRIALDKFKNRYNTAKSKFISRLSSYLYDLKNNLDPMARLKSGAHIRVQVESIKRCKVKGSTKNKENEMLNPQDIPVRKKRKTGKKEHNLGKNISKNQPN